MTKYGKHRTFDVQNKSTCFDRVNPCITNFKGAYTIDYISTKTL